MTSRYRSFFWPAILILVGVFALLVNSGLVPAERLDRLVDLWPLILIVIGLELLAIVGAAAYVALGPAIPTGTQTLDTSAKLGTVDHASVRIDVGAANITMQGGSSI